MVQAVTAQRAAAANASAASLAWLRQELSLSGDKNSSLALRVWREVRDAMRRAPGGQHLEGEHYWTSHHWIAKTGREHLSARVEWAAHRLDEWPTLGVCAVVVAPAVPAAKGTNHEASAECSPIPTPSSRIGDGAGPPGRDGGRKVRRLRGHKDSQIRASTGVARHGARLHAHGRRGDPRPTGLRAD